MRDHEADIRSLKCVGTEQRVVDHDSTRRAEARDPCVSRPRSTTLIANLDPADPDPDRCGDLAHIRLKLSIVERSEVVEQRLDDHGLKQDEHEAARGDRCAAYQPPTRAEPHRQCHNDRYSERDEKSRDEQVGRRITEPAAVGLLGEIEPPTPAMTCDSNRHGSNPDSDGRQDTQEGSGAHAPSYESQQVTGEPTCAPRKHGEHDDLQRNRTSPERSCSGAVVTSFGEYGRGKDVGRSHIDEVDIGNRCAPQKPSSDPAHYGSEAHER